VRTFCIAHCTGIRNSGEINSAEFGGEYVPTLLSVGSLKYLQFTEYSDRSLSKTTVRRAQDGLRTKSVSCS
jgi:hypothetical protein